ncbi:hypothetical protein Syun_027979 [Stephania yunnanensis]|uniref:Uncharacterized protein n=1 Tax=Stephania yunnanensis TaxID=152371 RepID=A0AAP0ENU4_9MAGN
MVRLDIDVLSEKTITHEVIERYRRVDGYEDKEDEKEKAEITNRETERRMKIRDGTRRILEEMSEARHGECGVAC